jgi:hypothetical protein
MSSYFFVLPAGMVTAYDRFFNFFDKKTHFDKNKFFILLMSFRVLIAYVVYRKRKGVAYENEYAGNGIFNFFRHFFGQGSTSLARAWREHCELWGVRLKQRAGACFLSGAV